MTEQDDKARDREWAVRLGHWGLRVVAVVFLLALVFTMVNVQSFAAQGHGANNGWWWIAWLLDPMAALTAITAIVFEGFLADHGQGREPWLAATKFYALACTWGMNIWDAVFVERSPKAVLLHSVAIGLVFFLAEAAPRVRKRLALILAESQAGDSAREPTSPTQPLPAPQLPWRPIASSFTSPIPASSTATVVTQPIAAPTHPAVQPTQTGSPPKPLRTNGTEVSGDLVARAKAWAKGQRNTGWRSLQAQFDLTQSTAKELARLVNPPKGNTRQLERVS